MPPKQPLGVTLLLWLVLSLSAWGVVRLLGALRWWDVLNEFGARLNPLYLSITAVGWIVAGAALLLGLFRGKSWIRLAIPVCIGLWIVEYWVERIFFESPRANFLFALMLSILLFTVTVVSALNRKTKIFLVRSEEHEQPNEYTEPA